MPPKKYIHNNFNIFIGFVQVLILIIFVFFCEMIIKNVKEKKYGK